MEKNQCCLYLYYTFDIAKCFIFSPKLRFFTKNIIVSQQEYIRDLIKNHPLTHTWVIYGLNMATKKKNRKIEKRNYMKKKKMYKKCCK